MKTLDLIFFGLKGKINGPKALKELESLGVIKGNKIVYDDNDKILEAKGKFYQFNLSSCIRQQNSLTAQFVSFSLSNLANIFYPPPNFYNN